MGTFDWLFGQTAPNTVQTGSTSEVGLPAWYQDILKGTLSKADAASSQPYQPFTGDRVADLTPDQMAAYEQVRGLPGLYAGALGEAGETLGGVAPNALGAANPFLEAAGAKFPGAVNEYMSPYIDGVVNRIAELGGRNLRENLLPGVNDTFISAGQFGGSRNADFTLRALRDTQESVLGQQANALNQGYTTAGNLFTADANRQAGLASTAGGLSNLDTTAGMNLSDKFGDLAKLTSDLGIKSSAALEASGQAQQQQQQNELNTNYQNFLEQRDYPMNQVKFFSDILRGTPSGSQTTTTTGTAPATGGTSPLGQLAGAGTALGALLDLKRGGLVRRKYKRGGLVALREAA